MKATTRMRIDRFGFANEEVKLEPAMLGDLVVVVCSRPLGDRLRWSHNSWRCIPREAVALGVRRAAELRTLSVRSKRNECIIQPIGNRWRFFLSFRNGQPPVENLAQLPSAMTDLPIILNGLAEEDFLSPAQNTRKIPERDGGFVDRVEDGDAFQECYE